MMRTTWCARGLLAFVCVGTSACLIDLEGLDAGSGQSDDAGDDEGNAALDECLQGSSPAGASEAVEPGCPVECASGWGHEVAALEHAWTVDVGLASDANLSAVLSQGIDGSTLVVLGGDPIRFVKVGPDGTILSDEPQSFSGSVMGLEIMDVGEEAVCLLWHDGTTVQLHIPLEIGVLDFEIGPLGPANLAALDEGLVVAHGGMLHWVADEAVTPFAAVEGRVGALPSGGMVAASSDAVTWLDAQGSVIASRGLPLDMVVHDLLALDDSRVILVGSDPVPTDSGIDGIALELDPNGEAWLQRYDRATSWCGERTHEGFAGLARTDEGSIWLAGLEGASYPFGTIDTLQPLVLQLDAEGEALALDRGAWAGWASDVVSSGDAALALVSEWNAEGDLHMWLRKYAPGS